MKLTGIKRSYSASESDESGNELSGHVNGIKAQKASPSSTSQGAALKKSKRAGEHTPSLETFLPSEESQKDMWDKEAHIAYVRVSHYREERIRVKNAQLWRKASLHQEELIATEKTLGTLCSDAILKGKTFIRWCKEEGSGLNMSSTAFLDKESATCQAAVRMMDLYFDVKKVSTKKVGNEVLALSKDIYSYSVLLSTVFRDVLMLWMDVGDFKMTGNADRSLQVVGKAFNCKTNHTDEKPLRDGIGKYNNENRKEVLYLTDLPPEMGIVTSKSSEGCSTVVLREVREENGIGNNGQQQSPEHRYPKKVYGKHIREEVMEGGPRNVHNKTDKKKHTENMHFLKKKGTQKTSTHLKRRQGRVGKFTKDICTRSFINILEKATNAMSIKLPKQAIHNLAEVLEAELSVRKGGDKDFYYTSACCLIRWLQKNVIYLKTGRSDELREVEHHAWSLLLASLKNTAQVPNFMKVYRKLL